MIVCRKLSATGWPRAVWIQEPKLVASAKREQIIGLVTVR
jgi:hypothetical protein